MRRCGAAGSCGPAGDRPRPDDVPLRSALHPRALPGRRRGARLHGCAAAHPRPRPGDRARDQRSRRGGGRDRAHAADRRRSRLRCLRASRPAGRLPRRGSARAGGRGPRAQPLRGAAPARRSRRRRPLPRPRRSRARDLGNARRRRRRAALQRRRGGRRIRALPPLAQRPRSRLPLHGRATGRGAGPPHVHSVARRQRHRLRLSLHARGAVARALHGRPQRGRRRPRRSRGSLATQARRAPRPRRADCRCRSVELHEAALDWRHHCLLPRLLRPRLGAGGRRRALQGPGHGPGHARCDVHGQDAGRARAAGPRRRCRGRSRNAPLGGRARPPLPPRLPLRQRRHADRGPLARAGRAAPRCRAERGARSRRPLRPGALAAGDRRPAAAQPGACDGAAPGRALAARDVAARPQRSCVPRSRSGARPRGPSSAPPIRSPAPSTRAPRCRRRRRCGQLAERTAGSGAEAESPSPAADPDLAVGA